MNERGGGGALYSWLRKTFSLNFLRHFCRALFALRVRSLLYQLLFNKTRVPYFYCGIELTALVLQYNKQILFCYMKH